MVGLQAVDFDGHSLRKSLPVTVRVLNDALSRGQRVYVHCTAGLGRAPAVCIAYLYWYHDFTLDEASPSQARAYRNVFYSSNVQNAKDVLHLSYNFFFSDLYHIAERTKAVSLCCTL